VILAIVDAVMPTSGYTPSKCAISVDCVKKHAIFAAHVVTWFHASRSISLRQTFGQVAEE